MIPEAPRWVLYFVLNAGWQVPLVAATAWLVARILLRRAPARYVHAVWMAAAVLAVLLPVLSTIGIALVQRSSRPTAVEPVAPPAASNEPANADPAPAPLALAAASAKREFAIPAWVAWLVPLAVIPFALWRTVRLALAWWSVRRLRAAARPIRCEPVLRMAEDCRQRLNAPVFELLESSSLEGGPVTFGWLQPVILLPERFAGEEPPEWLMAALAHEIAHLRRRDFAVNWVIEALLIPLAWHPAAAVWIRRSLNSAREMACDECAASTGAIEPRRYAASLIAIAAEIRRPPRVCATALGVTDGAELEERVRSLLRGPLAGPARARMQAAAGAAALLTTALLVVPAGFPVPAQDRSTAPPDRYLGLWEGLDDEVIFRVEISRAASGELEARIWTAIQSKGNRRPPKTIEVGALGPVRLPAPIPPPPPPPPPPREPGRDVTWVAARSQNGVLSIDTKPRARFRLTGDGAGVLEFRDRATPMKKWEPPASKRK